MDEFNYENVDDGKTCQYIIYTATGEKYCGKPAIAFGWWEEEEKNNGQLLCRDHLTGELLTESLSRYDTDMPY